MYLEDSFPSYCWRCMRLLAQRNRTRVSHKALYGGEGFELYTYVSFTPLKARMFAFELVTSAVL